MKSFFSIIIIYLFLFSSCQNGANQKANCDGCDSVMKQYYKAGQLLAEVPYKGGKRNGVQTNYTQDGKIASTITFFDDVRNGESVMFYSNGKPFRTTNYVNGIINGNRKKYYDDGKLMSETPFENGKQIDGLKEYNRDGSLRQQPTIVFKTENKLKASGEFYLLCSVSDKNTKVRFNQLYELGQGKFERDTIPTTNGIGRLKYKIPRGSFRIERVIIEAEIATDLENSYVTKATYDLKAENK